MRTAGKNPAVLSYLKEEDRLLYALIIFIGAHSFTIGNGLTLSACERAISISSDGKIMRCVMDQEI
jgi:hypothetical protein